MLKLTESLFKSMFVACIVGALIAPMAPAQSTTDTVALQARLTGPGGTTLANGLYRVRFSIYPAESGGVALWTESQPSVPVTDGLSNTILFGETPAPEGIFEDWASLWLEITVDSDNDGFEAEEIFAPRTPLNAVPIALYAKDSAGLGGIPAADYALTTDVNSDIDTLSVAIESAMAVQDEAISAKADAVAVASGLASKADSSVVDAALAAKADQIAVDASQAAQDAVIAARLGRTGSAYVMVDVVDSAVQNGINLLSAYQAATLLTPQGQPLGASNRAAVIVLPGRYDLGNAQLLLDAEFVDIVGLSSAPDSQWLQGVSSGPSTGVLAQTADNVHIENLTVECALSAGGTTNTSTDPAAYFPESNLVNTVVRNCRFVADGTNAWSMRVGVNYGGHYESCSGGAKAFGAHGAASGTFVDCTGGNYAFGSIGEASGTFIDCTGSFAAFGYDAFASGTFTRCRAGDSSFGALQGASGSFTDCIAGMSSFAGGGATASGTFVNCTAGPSSFGGSGGTASGTFTNCTAGFSSFGAVGTANGNFTNCVAGSWSGTFTGRMENCRWNSDINLGTGARVYASTFVGQVNLSNTTAGITQSRAGTIINDANNVFGATNSVALNIEDIDVN